MTYDGNCLDGEYDYDQVYDWRNKKWVNLDKGNEIKDTTFFIQELDNDDDLDMVYDLVKNEWVGIDKKDKNKYCLLDTSPSPRDSGGSRMPSSA